MSKKTSPAAPPAPLRFLPASLLLRLALAVGAAADSPFDLSTPAGLRPGAPAGFFAPSNVENVNPLNGNVNLSLPLLRIGGRGAVGYTMTAATWIRAFMRPKGRRG